MSADFDMNGFQILNAKVGMFNLSELAEAAESAIQAAIDSEASAEEAAQSAASASADADRAEAAAESLSDITTSPVQDWAQGTVVTSPGQRYLFNGVLFIAPSASVGNPITQGLTPIGDPNWTDWSTPNYYYNHDEFVVADKSVFILPLGFYEISDVFWESTFQPPSSYTIDTGLNTVTFDSPVPAGTFVRIWAGRIKNDVIADYEETILNATPITYDAGTIVAPEDIFRPNEKFDKATLFVNGVAQREGASFSYIIEVDSLDSNFNQIRFSEPLPAGAQLYGELRRG
jgi:hypothetical protein